MEAKCCERDRKITSVRETRILKICPLPPGHCERCSLSRYVTGDVWRCHMWIGDWRTEIALCDRCRAKVACSAPSPLARFPGDGVSPGEIPIGAMAAMAGYF